MRVLITGGLGRIGKAATERLLQRGWEVRILDLAAKTTLQGVDYVQGSILNFDDLREAMRGCHAVIHLAAVPNPYLAPGHEVFQTNTAGTFNVFEAAAAVGIRRVIQASSINALGAFYHTTDIKPQYFPIDEDHPCYTADPYSFSKQVVENIGQYYWRREAISSLAFRFPGVYAKDYTETDAYIQWRDPLRRLLDEIVSLPDSKRQAMIADVSRRVLEYRHERPYEYGAAKRHEDDDSYPDDPLFHTYNVDRFNYWTFLDERDAAQSFEKGLTADYEGAHVLFVNDPYNALLYDSRTLIRSFFPDVTTIKADLSGANSLVSIQRAKDLIGFEPQYSVQSKA